MKTVSVIIPFYNGVEWLCEAVESVLNQTYKAIEIIVVNDGSKEDISYFLDRYRNSVNYVFKENGGPATARNLGIDISTGDYIAFLDSDDVWLPEKLEFQIKAMEVNGSKWSHTAYETFDTDKIEPNTIKTIDIRTFDGMIYPKMVLSNPLATPCIVIDGNLLRQNSTFRFNNKMRYGQDQYLWLQIAKKYKILAINKVLVKVRIRGNNAAFRARVQLQQRGVMYKILLDDRKNYNLLPISSQIAYKICDSGSRVVYYLENNNFSEKNIENISKILYFLPWLMFKINFIFRK